MKPPNPKPTDAFPSLSPGTREAFPNLALTIWGLLWRTPSLASSLLGHLHWPFWLLASPHGWGPIVQPQLKGHLLQDAFSGHHAERGGPPPPPENLPLTQGLRCTAAGQHHPRCSLLTA